MYRDSEHRYLNDVEFRRLVDTLEHSAETCGFTPGELKQAAFYAALRLEIRRPRPFTMSLENIMASRQKESE